MIAILNLSIVSYQISKDQEYSFKNNSDFERYEKLYDLEESAFIITDYSDTELTLKLRYLASDIEESYYFDSKKEYDRFIQNNTMGKDVYIPVLSGDVTFDKSSLTASYQPIVKFENIYYSFHQNRNQGVLMYMLYLNILLLCGWRTGNKNEKKTICCY